MKQNVPVGGETVNIPVGFDNVKAEIARGPTRVSTGRQRKYRSRSQERAQTRERPVQLVVEV